MEVAAHMAGPGLRAMGGPSWPCEATKLCFAPTSRPSTFFSATRTWMPGTSPGTTAEAGLDVQHVLAGEFRLVRDEGEPRLRLGAHQALHGIRGTFTII